MAADSTYNPLIYRKQGGSEMVFESGSTLTFNAAIDGSGAGTQTATAGSAWTTGSTWVANSAAGGTYFKVLASTTATSGDFATMRLRARSSANTSGGVICVNASASANIAEYGNLYAVQGYAQPGANAQTGADNIICGLYSCTDMTSTGSSGRDWSCWIDTHAAAKAAGGSYLLRLSHNGSVANDGVMTIYGGGRMPVFCNVEDATPGFFDATPGTYSTADGVIVWKINGTTYYQPLFTAVD